jgi:lipoyl(octanoyl) transferase
LISDSLKPPRHPMERGLRVRFLLPSPSDGEGPGERSGQGRKIATFSKIPRIFMSKDEARSNRPGVNSIIRYYLLLRANLCCVTIKTRSLTSVEDFGRIMQICNVHLLGLTPYDDASLLQARLADEIASGQRPPTLLLLEHLHVFTLGRRAESRHLLWDEATLAEKRVDVKDTDRGGDITYHGPGQLVGYPLLPLAPPVWQSARLPQADFVGYIRKLENVLIETLRQFGLAAIQRPGLTGVWIAAEEIERCLGASAPQPPQPAKIASIGVKVDARGVSRHGFALNVDPDMSYWDGIIPCGLDGVRMTSLAQLLETPPAMNSVISEVISAFGKRFGYTMIIKR